MDMYLLQPCQGMHFLSGSLLSQPPQGRGAMRIKILGRKNLKMTSGKLAAQSVHAALNLYKQNPQDHWSCVVLEVSDKKFEEAKEAHPEAYVVHDAGYTEVQAGTQTCLAFYENDPREQEVIVVTT
jgi:peptidyl-tRNA hydrolase